MVKKRLYVAYGSNLNIQQMRLRCPTARLVGTGIVEDHELQFKGAANHSYATIAENEGETVPVAVWELQPRDEKFLDRYEGYPSHYFKQDISVKIFQQMVSGSLEFFTDKSQPQQPCPESIFFIVGNCFRFPSRFLNKCLMAYRKAKLNITFYLSCMER